MIILGGTLKAEDLADGRHRRLLADYTITVVVRGKGLTITVPAGFVSDGGSVPWGLWNLSPPWGDYSVAFVVHDWLYYQGPKILPRAGADWVFLDVMKKLDEVELAPSSTITRQVKAAWRAARRYAIYEGVRIGGGFAWAAHRGKDKP